MKTVLSQLESIQEVKNLKSLRDLQETALREADLRQQIATLSEHRNACHALESDGQVMKSIGADILWLAWIDRRQSELTVELAKLLARKETLKIKSRKDTGRHANIEELADKERERVKKHRARLDLERAIDVAQVVATYR